VGKQKKNFKKGMLRSIRKLSRETVSPEEETEGYGGKDLQKRKVLSLI